MPRHDFSPKEPKRDVGGESFTPGFAYLGWVDAQDPKKRKPGKRKDVGGLRAIRAIRKTFPVERQPN